MTTRLSARRLATTNASVTSIPTMAGAATPVATTEPIPGYQLRRLGRMRFSEAGQKKLGTELQAKLSAAGVVVKEPGSLVSDIEQRISRFVAEDGTVDIIQMAKSLGEEEAVSLLQEAGVDVTPELLGVIQVSPYIKSDNTVDIVGMANVLGDGKTASALLAVGITLTPKVVEIIRTGKQIVESFPRARRGEGKYILASTLSIDDWVILTQLSGLTSGEAISQIETQYFNPLYEKAIRENNWKRPGKAEQEQIKNQVRIQAEAQISPELQSWYNSQVSTANQLLAEASAKYVAWKVDHKDAKGWQTDKVKMRFYPKWSQQYKAAKVHYEHSKELEAFFAKGRDVKLKIYDVATNKGTLRVVVSSELGAVNEIANQGATLVGDKPITKIGEVVVQGVKSGEYKAAVATVKEGLEIGAISLTETTIPVIVATAKEKAEGGFVEGCKVNIGNYTITTRDGRMVIVEAFSTDDATARAESAGYEVAWATKQVTPVATTQMAGVFTRSTTGGWVSVKAETLPHKITVGLYEVKNEAGKVIQIHAGSEDDARNIAHAYGLSGDIQGFTATKVKDVTLTPAQVSELVTNAKQTSGIAYGYMWKTISSAFGEQYAIPADSTPIHMIGTKNEEVVFLTPAQVAVFRKTGIYEGTRGSDQDKLTAAYTDYINAPKVKMLGGWTMLANSIKDALGNVLFWGFDSLSQVRQDEIKEQLETPTKEVKPPAAGEGGEISPDVPEGGAPNQSGMEPQCYGCCDPMGTYKIETGGNTWILRALSNDHALSLMGLTGQNATVKRIYVEDPSMYEKPVKIEKDQHVEESDEPTAQDVGFDVAAFEVNLQNQPAILVEGYNLGGFEGYNAAVEVYNDTVNTCNQLAALSTAGIKEIKPADWVKLGITINVTPPGPTVAEIPTEGLLAPGQLLIGGVDVYSEAFRQKYAAVIQPGNMSNEDYAQVAPFVTLEGFNGTGAYVANVPKELINTFILSTSSQDFRDKVASGEIVLLPYGAAMTKEDFGDLPTVYQKTLLESGFPGLEAKQAADTAANKAQSFLQNSWDSFHMANTQLVHGLKSTFYAEMAGNYKTTYKEGDWNPMFFATTTSPAMAALAIQSGYTTKEGLAASIFLWGKGNPRLTAAQAEEMNTANRQAIESWTKTYDELQKTQMNWEAEHPLLQPVFPEGPLQAWTNNPATMLNPLTYSETIFSTLPYCLATMGLMTVGTILGGPVGLAVGSAAAFAITYGTEGHQIYEDVLKNGGTRDQALRCMRIFGSLSAAVEIGGDAFFVGGLGAISKTISSALSRNVAQQFVEGAAKKLGWGALTTNIVIQFINQSGQEYVQQMLQNAAVKTVNENRALLEGANDAFVAGWIGTAPFVLFGGAGEAIRLTKGTNIDVSGLIGKTKGLMARERGVAIQTLQPFANLVNTKVLGNSAAARKAAALFVAVGGRVTEYVAASVELQAVRNAIKKIGAVANVAEQDELERLREQEQELADTVAELETSMKQTAQVLVDHLSSMKKIDEATRQELSKMPGSIAGTLNSLISQLEVEAAPEVVLGKEAPVKREKPHPVTPKPATVEVVAAELYDAGYGLGDLLRMAKNLPENTREVFYDVLYKMATSMDLSMRRAAAALNTGKLYLTQTLPQATERTLQGAVNHLEQAQASAREAIVKARDLLTKDLAHLVVKVVTKNIPGAAMQTLRNSLKALDAATAAVNAVVARARVFILKDLPTDVVHAYVVAVNGVDSAILVAGRTMVRAENLLTKEIPATVANDVRIAKEALADAITEAHNAIANWRTQATEKALETIQAAREEVVKATIRMEQALAAVDVFLMDTLPNQYIDLAKSKIDQAATEVQTLMMQKLPAQARKMVETTQRQVEEAIEATRKAVQDAIEATRGAIVRARELTTKKLYDVALQSLRQAARTVDVARKAIDRLDKLLAKDIPQAARTRIEAMLTAMRGAVQSAGQSILAAEHFLTVTIPVDYVNSAIEKYEGVKQQAIEKFEAGKQKVVMLATETVPAAARKGLDATVEQLQDALLALRTIETTIKQFAVVRLPQASRRIIHDVTIKVRTTITETQRALKEAKHLIAEGAHRRALIVVNNAISVATTTISEVRTLLAMAREGLISLPGKTIETLENGVALLETSIDQAAYYAYNTGRQLTVRTIQGAEDLLRGTRHLYEASTSRFAEGVDTAMEGKPKAELPVRAQQRAWASEIVALKVNEAVRSTVEAELRKALRTGRIPAGEQTGYNSLIGEMTRMIGTLLRAVQGTEFEDEVESTVGEVASGLVLGDVNQVERAAQKLRKVAPLAPMTWEQRWEQMMGGKKKHPEITKAEFEKRMKLMDTLEANRVQGARRQAEQAASMTLEGAVAHMLGLRKQAEMTKEEWERRMAKGKETEEARKARERAEEREKRGAAATWEQQVGTLLGLGKQHSLTEQLAAILETEKNAKLREKLEKNWKRAQAAEEKLKEAESQADWETALANLLGLKTRTIAEQLEAMLKVEKDLKLRETLTGNWKKVQKAEEAFKKAQQQIGWEEQVDKMLGIKRNGLAGQIERAREADSNAKFLEELLEKQKEALKRQKERGPITWEEQVKQIFEAGRKKAAEELPIEETKRKKRRRVPVGWEQELGNILGLKGKAAKDGGTQKARELADAGGTYIAMNADRLVKALRDSLAIRDIKESDSWGDARVKLEDYLAVLSQETGQGKGEAETRIGKLTKDLTQALFEMREAAPEEYQPTSEESEVERRYQERLQKLMERLPQYVKDHAYRLLESKDPADKRAASDEIWEYLEAIYSRKYLDEYLSGKMEAEEKGIGEEPTEREMAEKERRGGPTEVREGKIYYRGEGGKQFAERKVVQFYTTEASFARKFGSIIKRVISPKNPLVVDTSLTFEKLGASQETLSKLLGEKADSIAEYMALAGAKGKPAVDDYIAQLAKAKGYDALIIPEYMPLGGRQRIGGWIGVLDQSIVKEIAEEAEEAEEGFREDVENAIKEAERILKENRDRPPDSPPPSEVRSVKPPERGGGGGRGIRVAVKERVETKEEVATEELTAEEEKALEEAKKKKVLEEFTEKEKKALEKAQKAEQAAKEREKRATEAMEKQEQGRVTQKRTATAESTLAIVSPILGPGYALPAGVEQEVVAGTRAIPLVTTKTKQKAAPLTVTEPEVITQPEVIAQPEVQAITKTQAETQAQAQTQTQAQTQAETQVQTQVQAQVEAQPQTQTKTLAKAVTKTKTMVLPRPPYLPPGAAAVKEAYKKGIPILIWRMGTLKDEDVWKAVVDPQRQRGLLTVIGTANLPVPPRKYATGKGSARATVQWLGKGPRHAGSADLGIMDVFWDRDGENLRFEAGGLKTDVGVRIPGPTTGITIEGLAGVNTEIETKPILKPKRAAKVRVLKRKKSKRRGRRLTDYDYATTLKGFDPYTFEGV